MRKDEVRDLYTSINDIGDFYGTELSELVESLELDLEFLGEAEIARTHSVKDHAVATTAEAYGIARDLKGYDDRGMPSTFESVVKDLDDQIQTNEPYTKEDVIYFGRLLNEVSEDVGYGDYLESIDLVTNSKDDVVDMVVEFSGELAEDLAYRKPV